MRQEHAGSDSGMRVREVVVHGNLAAGTVSAGRSVSWRTMIQLLPVYSAIEPHGLQQIAANIGIQVAGGKREIFFRAFHCVGVVLSAVEGNAQLSVYPAQFKSVVSGSVPTEMHFPIRSSGCFW